MISNAYQLSSTLYLKSLDQILAAHFKYFMFECVHELVLIIHLPEKKKRPENFGIGPKLMRYDPVTSHKKVPSYTVSIHIRPALLTYLLLLQPNSDSIPVLSVSLVLRLAV